MEVSKEEILHIAKLANLNIKDEEIDKYAKNLEDILNFVKVLNNVDTENVEEAIGTTNSFNVFRKGFQEDFNIDILNFLSISSLANEVFNTMVYYPNQK